MSNALDASERKADAKIRRRIARGKYPDLRAIGYFVHEMRHQDGITIRAALRYLTDRYTYAARDAAKETR